MATTTVGGTSVTFSNSTAAYSGGAVIDEMDTSYAVTFDVLALGGGGAKTTLYSVDDGINSGTIFTSNPAFSAFNTDLLAADRKGMAYAETSRLGARFWIGEDNRIHYDASGIANAIHRLGLGETMVDTFQYTIRLANGTLSVGTLSVTLKGENDGVTISAGTDATGTVTEDATSPNLADSGVIAFNDKDLADTHTVGAVSSAGNMLGGSLQFGAVSESPSTEGGSVGWTYTVANSAAQYLGKGETVVEKFTVTVADGHGGDATQEVSITVTGVNDAVTVVAEGTDAAGSVTEDVASPTMSDTGTIAFNDVDLTDLHTATVIAAATNSLGGILTTAAAVESATTEGGTIGWTYEVANSAVQYLGEGEQATETFTVTIDDHNGSTVTQDVTLTVTGVNDEVKIVDGGDTGAAVDEDSTLVTGDLAFTDADLSDTHTVAVAPVSTNTTAYGSLAAILADGPGGGAVTWTYTVDNAAAQKLGLDESTIEKFDITVNDGHGGDVTQTIAITITGSNDAPVITDGDTAAYAIDENATGVVATLAATDADEHDSPTWSLLAGDDSALFQIDPTTGALSLETAQDYENPAHPGNDLTVRVQVSDGHTGGTAVQTVTVSINDLAESGLTNNVPIPGAGAADPYDFDDLPGNNAFFSTPQNDTLSGTFFGDQIVGKAGNDVISGRNGNDALYGQRGADRLFGDDGADSLYGGSGNDSLVGGSSFGADADTLLGGSGNDTLNGRLGDDLLIGGYGADTITGEAGNDVIKFLSVYDSGDTITDFTPGEDKIDLTAFKDTGGTRFHFAGFSPTTAAAHSLWQVGDTIYGDMDGNVNTYEFTFKVQPGLTLAASDFLLSGGNSEVKFVAGGDIAGSVDEDAASVAGTIAFTDPDLSDTHTVSVAKVGPPGSLFGNLSAVVADGPGGGTVAWSYTVNNYFTQALGAGESAIETYEIRVSDGHYGDAFQTVTVTIAGSNDVPVITSDTSYAIDENATGLVATMTGYDWDQHDSVSWSLVSGDDSALFQIDANTGALSLLTAQDYENPLHLGNTLTVNVQASDGHTGGTTVQTLTVNIRDLIESGLTDNVPVPGVADPNDFDNLTANGPSTTYGTNNPDSINGSSGNDLIYGRGQADTISGGFGNDSLYGQAGDDRLFGNDGADTMYGGSGNDTLNGGQLGDTLYGGTGNDILIGDAGNDLLIGGFGADTITGGSGNDVIRFLSVFDSGDTITDFTAGEDKIDLSSFKDASGTAFHFAGFSATTPAAHSLWQINYGIFGDMDGDLTTYEFTFNVQANTTLAASDFLL